MRHTVPTDWLANSGIREAGCCCGLMEDSTSPSFLRKFDAQRSRHLSSTSALSTSAG